jgi:hypothetical protein
MLNLERVSIIQIHEIAEVKKYMSTYLHFVRATVRFKDDEDDFDCAALVLDTKRNDMEGLMKNNRPENWALYFGGMLTFIRARWDTIIKEGPKHEVWFPYGTNKSGTLEPFKVIPIKRNSN